MWLLEKFKLHSCPALHSYLIALLQSRLNLGTIDIWNLIIICCRCWVTAAPVPWRLSKYPSHAKQGLESQFFCVLVQCLVSLEIKDLQGAPLKPSSTHLSTSPGGSPQTVSHHFPLLMRQGKGLPSSLLLLALQQQGTPQLQSFGPFSLSVILFMWDEDHRELAPLVYPSFHYLYNKLPKSKSGFWQFFYSNQSDPGFGLGLSCSVYLTVGSSHGHYKMFYSTPDL